MRVPGPADWYVEEADLSASPPGCQGPGPLLQDVLGVTVFSTLVGHSRFYSESGSSAGCVTSRFPHVHP